MVKIYIYIFQKVAVYGRILRNKRGSEVVCDSILCSIQLSMLKKYQLILMSFYSQFVVTYISVMNWTYTLILNSNCSVREI